MLRDQMGVWYDPRDWLEAAKGAVTKVGEKVQEEYERAENMVERAEHQQKMQTLIMYGGVAIVGLVIWKMLQKEAK